MTYRAFTAKLTCSERRWEVNVDLIQKNCVPCEGGVPRLGPAEIQALLPQLPGWRVVEDRKLERRFEFKNFASAMAFVNRMATLAESEAHHPDFCVRYALVDVSVSTHDIAGLSENDFILAAKINQL